MTPNSIILVIIAIVVIAGLFYFMNQQNANRGVSVQQPAPIEDVCVPFTKAQQEAEKRQKQANCASKLLIPFVGQVQYYACIKNVAANLTPIVNC